MSGIMVPKARAEAPNQGGGESVFPEGSFVGVIEKVVVRPFPEFIAKALADGASNRGYSSGDGEILSIWLSDNTPVGDASSPGARKMFVDFVIRDGKAEISDGNAIPEASWQMQRDAALLTNLALALGATEEVTYEGETYLVTTDGFLQQLIEGDLNGSKVGFVTSHRKWTSKATGKSGTEVRTTEFFGA